MLETTRLMLRPMLAGDVDDLLAVFTDLKVVAAFATVPFDRKRMTSWVQRNLEHQAAYGYGLFSVLLKPTGLLIGNCGLESTNVEGVSVAELGYDFRSDYWNQGYATEAAKAVRDYAFEQVQLPRLISLIRQSNLPSQRVAEKVGMRRVRALERYGRPYWLYALTRSGSAPG